MIIYKAIPTTSEHYGRICVVRILHKAYWISHSILSDIMSLKKDLSMYLHGLHTHHMRSCKNITNKLFVSARAKV